jgi:hypothetical protein
MNNSIGDWVGRHNDVAANSRADDGVRWNEERYRTLFDLGPVAVYSCDDSGVIQEFNCRAVELWGCEPAAGDTDKRFCGSFKLFRPDGRFMPHDQCPMAEVITGALLEACDEEVVIERPDSSRITVVVNIRPLKSDRGAIIGAINCFYDITARKETEETLRDSNREAGILEVSSSKPGRVGTSSHQSSRYRDECAGPASRTHGEAGRRPARRGAYQPGQVDSSQGAR